MNIFDKETRQKKKVLEELLEQKFVMAHLNPKIEHVIVPDHLKENSTLTLQLSLRFRGEMSLEKTCVKADLLFSGDYFSCEIPYSSIWALTSEAGETQLWPDSMPEELRSGELKIEERKEDHSKEEEEEDLTQAPFTPKSKGHLKLVK